MCGRRYVDHLRTPDFVITLCVVGYINGGCATFVFTQILSCPPQF